MSDTITIPPEALEAAARELKLMLASIVDADTRATELTDEEHIVAVNAACLAMLRSWPGAYDNGPRKQWQHYTPAITLPLPTETTNKETENG